MAEQLAFDERLRQRAQLTRTTGARAAGCARARAAKELLRYPGQAQHTRVVGATCANAQARDAAPRFATMSSKS